MDFIKNLIDMYGIRINDNYIHFGKLNLTMFDYEIDQDVDTIIFKSNNGKVIIGKNKFLYIITIY